MPDPHAAPATMADSRTLTIGIVVGLAIALTFALIIRLVPAWVLVETGPRIALYVLLALAAVPTVLPLWALAARIGAEQRRLAWAAVGGAMLFDGLALGFVPQLYGQTGDAWAYTAAALIWAFATVVITELLVERRRAA